MARSPPHRSPTVSPALTPMKAVTSPLSPTLPPLPFESGLGTLDPLSFDSFSLDGPTLPTSLSLPSLPSLSSLPCVPSNPSFPSLPTSPKSPSVEPLTLRRNEESLSLSPRKPRFRERLEDHAEATLWDRVGKMVSSVGRGLLADQNCRVILKDHWLEVADPKHRYGTLLKPYHEIWKASDSSQNFFFWLDRGEGKSIDLPESPRNKLECSAVSYLDSVERFKYLVTLNEGKLTYQASGELVHTLDEQGRESDKWIFVVDPRGKLFVAKKVKGRFHHSSFLSGGSAKVAGNLCVSRGVITRISRASGHYRPSEDDLRWFLQSLAMRGVDISRIIVEDYC